MIEEQERGMKDKRNRHRAVGKSSSEQHFHKSAVASLPLLWSPTSSTTKSYGRLAGRVADEIQVNLENFKIGCRLKYLSFRFI